MYFEEAGRADGIPLLCQHTAGTDSRQYRHVLEDAGLQQNFRIIAYDLPYHGRSLPPTEVEWWKSAWRLTRGFFMSVPLAMSKALALERPVFMGSSIGGMVAVDLACYHPSSFRAVVALEAAIATATRPKLDDPARFPQEALDALHDPMRHPRANGAGNGMWMYGLTAPQCPEPYRREVSWVYSQGAPGVFSGDLYYYNIDHDLRQQIHTIDTSEVGVYLLTGEYDWSATPELTEQLHAAVKGSKYVKMKGIGHFPMCNPDVFMQYARPVFDEIVAGSRNGAPGSKL